MKSAKIRVEERKEILDTQIVHFYKDVPYIKKKDLKDKKYYIVCSTQLKEKTNSEISVYYKGKEYEAKERIFGFTKGYILTENDELIVLKRRNFLLFFFLLLLAGSFIVLALTINHPVSPPSSQDNPPSKVQEEKENPPEEKKDNDQFQQPKKETYNIEYVLNGGTLKNPPNRYIYGTSLELPKPARLGYDFGGWYKDINLIGNSISKITNDTRGNIILYANWIIESYKIAYNLNGGELETINNNYTVDSETFNIGTPTRKGYTFDGWTGSNGKIPQKNIVINKGSTGDLSYTANWLIVNYAISYNLNHGELETMNNYTIESDIISLGTPTRKGYTFNGWTGSNGTVPELEVIIEKGNIGDLEYEANWKVNTYNLTYNLNGGELETINNYTVDSETFNIGTPAKKGYTFDGWAGSNGTVPELEVIIEKGNIGDLEYEANWKVNTYNLTYNLNGGELETINNYTVDSETFNIGTPTRKGYIFDGWTGSNGTEPELEVSIKKGSIGDLEYEANWKVNTYNLAYYLNGGVLDTIDNYTVESKTFSIGTPTRSGYTFIGWTGSNGTTPELEVIIEKGSVGDVNLHANWDIIIYEISYNLNQGSVSTPQNPINYNVETNTFTLKSPTRPGYTFDGWTGSNGNAPQEVITINNGTIGNLIYSANWKVVNYDITYNLNGGTATNPTSFNSEKETFKLKNPTRTGYTFVGWTGSNGIEPKLEVSIAKGSIGDLSYTANWEAISYSIFYKLNEGIATNPDAYIIETENFTLNAPTRPGYTFTGWTGSNGEDPKLEVIVEKGSIGNKSYTANWQIVNYNISYNLNGGSATNPSSYNIEMNTFSLNEPTRTGYTFDGWTGSNGSTAQTSVSISSGTIGNLSYTANWKVITYTISYNLGGGTLSNPQNSTTYTIESDSFTLRNPSRTGYSFVGWSGTGLPSSNNTSVTIQKGSTGNRTYTANFYDDIAPTINSITWCQMRDDLYRPDGISTQRAITVTVNAVDYGVGIGHYGWQLVPAAGGVGALVDGVTDSTYTISAIISNSGTTNRDMYFWVFDHNGNGSSQHFYLNWSTGAWC